MVTFGGLVERKGRNYGSNMFDRAFSERVICVCLEETFWGVVVPPEAENDNQNKNVLSNMFVICQPIKILLMCYQSMWLESTRHDSTHLDVAELLADI